MAITQATCTSFKVEMLKAQHDFSASGGHSFKVALYTSSADLSAATTDYTTTGEVVGTGYTAGGAALTNVEPTSSGTTAYTDFADVSWAASTITARGALIYNTTTGGGSSTTDAVYVLDFGTDKTTSNQTFTIVFPTADATTAIIRITD